MKKNPVFNLRSINSLSPDRAPDCCINLHLQKTTGADARRFAIAFIEASLTKKSDLALLEMDASRGRYMLKVCGGPLTDAENWRDDIANGILRETRNETGIEVDRVTFGCS